jgi:hypothetical protein
MCKYTSLIYEEKEIIDRHDREPEVVDTDFEFKC